MDVNAFTTKQLSLLNSELAAETAATAALLASSSPTTLSRSGLAILNLSIASHRTGLGGKTVVELEQDHAIGNAGEIGEHGVKVGDIVKVGEQPKGSERKKDRSETEATGIEGVVVRVGQKGIQIALGKEDDIGEGLRGKLWV